MEGRSLTWGQTPFRDAKPPLRRQVAVAVLGFAAIAAVTVFVWNVATRKGEVEQLVEILSGTNAPDAEWAFEELKAVGDDQLSQIAEHVDDSQMTPLHFLHFASQVRSGAKFSRDAYSVGEVCRCALACYMVGDGLFDDSGLPLQSIVENVRSFLTAMQASGSDREQARSPVARENPGGLLPRVIVPPSRDPALQRVAREGGVDALLQLLTGDQPSLAHWAYETLKRLPDTELDRIIPHLRCDALAPIHALRADWPGGSTGGGHEKIGISVLLCVAVAERLGNAEIRRRLSGSDMFHPTPETAAAVESAWKTYRSTSPPR